MRFVPRIDGAVVNPAEATVGWLEPLHRQEFRFRVGEPPAGPVLQGSVAVYRGIFLIAEIPLRVAVSETAPLVGGPSVPSPAIRYRKIFPSYSHRDSVIVDSVVSHVRTTGDEYLRDVVALRSGEVWSGRLLELIDQADLFQLFWSSHSMRSPHVRNEWEHGLRAGRPGFVRPLYWEEPQPADPARDLPPETLRRLHFAKLSVAVPVLPPAGGPPPGQWEGSTSYEPAEEYADRSPSLRRRQVRGPATRRWRPVAVWAVALALVVAVVVGIVIYA